MGPVSSEYTKIGPGFAAFVVIFLLALALWLLLRNMNTRLRNVRYREEAEARGEQPGLEQQGQPRR